MNSIWITKAVEYCLYALIATAALVIISDMMQINFLSGYEDGIYPGSTLDDLAEEHVVRRGIVALIHIFPLLASYFIVGRWIYISSKINHLLGEKNLKYSPGWCVGWYFVPFANLVVPYRAMKEIYLSSFDKDANKGKLTQDMSFTFQAWWGTWLLAGFIRFYYGSMRASDEDPISGMSPIGYSDVASNVLLIVCSFYLLRIVQVVANNHKDKHFDLVYKAND